MTWWFKVTRHLYGVLFLSLWGSGAVAQAPSVVLASTTSTEQSGLFAHLLPAFKAAHGIDVKVVAVGTGQALDMARRGDADVLLVHDRAAEERFVAEGWGLRRYDVMYNDFVLLGPHSDPAQVRGRDIAAALQTLGQQSALFISRGDKSGTHAAELRYWSISGQGAPRGAGYRECGCGMGPALNMAVALGAYVLSDRGTWLSHRQKNGLSLLVEGDPRLFNPYGVIVVHPSRHPHVKQALAQQFVDWLTGPTGQAAIASFRVHGQQLFFPNAPR